MKVCVVGYGAMGKILANLLGDELACVVALECENKRLDTPQQARQQKTYCQAAKGDKRTQKH